MTAVQDGITLEPVMAVKQVKGQEKKGCVVFFSIKFRFS